MRNILQRLSKSLEDNLYIPEFLWTFWLDSSSSADLSYLTPWSVSPPVGLHVYDTYNNVLNPSSSDHPCSGAGIFDQIAQCAPSVKDHPAWEAVNIAFRTLEKDAETAMRSLLQQADAKPRPRVQRPYGLSLGLGKPPSQLEKPKLSLGPHSMRSLQKYLIFLRFRNGPKYIKLLGLARAGSLFMRRRGTTSYPNEYEVRLRDDRGDAFSDWVEMLRGFTYFITGAPSECSGAFDFICECIHRRYNTIQQVELCVGVASEPDEYILSSFCFGEVVDEDEDDTMIEDSGVSDPSEEFHYFFPISPTLTIYLFIDAPRLAAYAPRLPHLLHNTECVPSTLDHDIESSDDIYQRNAILLHTQARYIIFASPRAMLRTLDYYNKRRWLPGVVDYSKLLRGCREESVTYMLLVRASIEVIDLTDDVRTISDCAVSYGAFADVWKGLWSDRTDKNTKLVAMKVLRAQLVGFAQERLLKRLKKEVKAWYRLDHPHVAKLHGIVQLPNTIAMISPWCENGTIVRYLRDTNPDANRLQLLYEIASGIRYLHSHDPVVVHGDLKGGNILINSEGCAVITDFGLAKVKEEVSDFIDLPTSFFAGSTRWMAPELLLALLEDERKRPPPISTYSDVYAFASVCLEILTGKLPFSHRTNEHAVIFDVTRGVKPSRGSHRGCLGRPDMEMKGEGAIAELWELMDQCWEERPHDRPSMNGMCTFLENIRRM